MSQIAVVLLFAALCSFSCKKDDMKLGYWGRDLIGTAEIVKDKETKKASLKINESTNWKLYAGQSIESIDFTKPILEGNDKGIFAIDVTDDVRTYFQLITDDSGAILAERHLPMIGGYNFRDLGGFKTQDGRYTRWGKIFRSDDLHLLTDADLHYLSSIPLKSIVDFRSEEEISKAADKNPSSLKNNYQLTINPGNVLDFAEVTRKTESEMEQMMMKLNEILVVDSICISRYKDFFALLQNEEEIPLMFHCSAGKDRTGMGAALILYALGVDEETILNDYLASNYYLGDKYAAMKSEHPELAALFEVRPHYLKAGLTKIKEEYGSIDTFLKDVLKADTALMKEKYLY